MIMNTRKKRTTEAVQRLRLAFPEIPIYARAQDLVHLLELKKAGATDAILENAETSLQLGSKLLKGLGVMSDDVDFVSQLVRDSMELQAQDDFDKTEDRELDVMKPLQVRVADSVVNQVSVPPASPEGKLPRNEQIGIGTHVLRTMPDNGLQQVEDKDKGVLYCELTTQNGFPERTDDAGSEIDPSTPCVTTAEDV